MQIYRQLKKILTEISVNSLCRKYFGRFTLISYENQSREKGYHDGHLRDFWMGWCVSQKQGPTYPR